MNRLRDDVGDDPVAERGIELLRAYAATPLDAEMKRRVWGSLQQTRLRAVAPGPFPRMRLAAAAVILLGLAGTAGAMITKRWITPGRARTGGPAAEGAEAPTVTRTRRVAARVAPPSSTTTGADAVAADSALGSAVAEPGLAPTPVARESGKPVARMAAGSRAGHGAAGRGVAVASGSDRVARGTRPARAPVSATRMSDAGPQRLAERSSGADPQTAAAAARERTQVLDAMVALRRDHDGTRAGLLLDEYLRDYPRGVLREEALVLAVEAADARGDGPTARKLARTYQATYPSGRFSTFARDRAAADGR